MILDNISDQAENGGMLKLLAVLDEFTRESPAVELRRFGYLAQALQ